MDIHVEATRGHLENSIKTQEEKLKALDELADRMLREGHPDALA